MWDISAYLWVSVCVCAFGRTAWSAQLEHNNICGAGLSNINEHECNSTTGQKYIISFKDSGSFTLNCNNLSVFEFEVLPRFESKLRVPLATLEKCPPPTNGSIASALAAFNVELLQTEFTGNLSLINLPQTPPLTASHFAGLERLLSLEITDIDHQTAPAIGFLDPLRRQGLKPILLALNLQQLRLPQGELDHLPISLQQLTLRNNGLQRLSVSALELPGLTYLELIESQLESLKKYRLPQTLTNLNIKMKNTNLQVDTIPALEVLTLVNWMETRPGVLQPCNRLQNLQLDNPAVKELPERWVANCSSLKHLIVKEAKYLKSLPANLLQGATELTHVTLMRCALETLPENLFDDQNKLTNLDLQNNKLTTIPSGVFVGPVQSLQILNLSINQLSGSVWKMLESLTELTSLKLAYNTNLSDACVHYNGISSLNGLTKLSDLVLMNTNITRICRDWRENLTLLKSLNLRNTAISVLWYDDLQYRRDNSISSTTVNLQGAPITSVRLSESDYNKLGMKLTTDRVTILLDSPKIKCDCRMYWTRLALERINSTDTGLNGLRCSTKHYLGKISVDEMQCPAADVCLAAELPPGCRCTARPWHSAAGGRVLVRAHCENAALSYVPQLRATAEWVRGNKGSTELKMNLAKKLEHDDVLYDLLLANNNISVLRAADLRPRTTAGAATNTPPLQLHLRELNLTNNHIKGVAENATILIRQQQNLRVHLARNPLECDCSIGPLLRALSQHDLSAATCKGGKTLIYVTTDHCAVHVVPLAAWLIGALIALIAATAIMVACYANPNLRLILFVILSKLRLWSPKPQKDDGYLFDAFISFSHEDEKIVYELVERLESGPSPLRLCLHYRDWVPGRFIPDQIVESVRVSRRTVALISLHFLKSTWARAEFREAYALAMANLTPRLVVVLLDDPKTLPLDGKLRRYLRSNTYLRWGDLWFWDKLKLALSTPQQKVPKSSPPTAPVPAVTLTIEKTNPALVSPRSPLERLLSNDGQSESINLETFPPARSGKASPTPISTPSPPLTQRESGTAQEREVPPQAPAPLSCSPVVTVAA